jgi:hypothetical protein
MASVITASASSSETGLRAASRIVQEYDFADQRHLERLLVCKSVREGTEEIAVEPQASQPSRARAVTIRSEADHR